MAQDPDSFDWVLLARHLTGDLSPAEAEAAERWLNADARHRAALEELRAVWAATRGETSGWDVERAIAELKARAEAAASDRSGEASPRAPSRPAVPHPARRRRPWVAFAAGIAAVLAGIVLFRLSPWSTVSPRTSSTATIAEIRAPRGEPREVGLPDGSRVLLAAASALSYDSDFGVRHRTVNLTGEAYFEAVHEGAGAFQVLTPIGLARDVGTAFVVRAYPAAMQVVVTEGVVVLHAQGEAQATTDSLVLEASQLGRVLRDGNLVFVPRVDPADYLGWTRGQLTFENAPLGDVVQELRRWYEGDVRVSSARVARRRFTGRFTRGSLEAAVRLIAAVADVSVRQVDGTWVFEE